jgi:hypothetical protein
MVCSPSVRALALLAISAASAGCVLQPVDLEGRRCPCGEGWRCDVTRDRCVRMEIPMLDGGPPDARPVDPTECDDRFAGALFCDGFEFVHPGMRGGWSFELLEGTSQLATATEEVRVGARAARASIGTGSSRAAFGVEGLGPIDSGDLWLRGWILVPDTSILDAVSVLYLGNETGSEGLGFQLWNGGRTAAWIGPEMSWRSSMDAVVAGEWQCLRMHVHVADAPGGVYELFVGETMVARHEMIDTLVTGGFTTVEAGIEYSDATQAPITVYVDEVVLQRAQVPCD